MCSAVRSYPVHSRKLYYTSVKRRGNGDNIAYLALEVDMRRRSLAAGVGEVVKREKEFKHLIEVGQRFNGLTK